MTPSHRPLDPARDWVFFDERAPVPESVLPLIRPLTEEYARDVWRECVSEAARHTMLMQPWEWPVQVFGSDVRFGWHGDWNEGQRGRVADVLRRHLPWPADARALFFWERESAVEVPWRVFLDYWVNFLFNDEGPILFSRQHPEAVVFGPNGDLYVGRRPGVVAGGRRRVVAFGLDETLGVPVTDGQSVTGFRMRRGCGELLTDLRRLYALVLWSSRSRRDVEKALDHGLRGFFERTYTWDAHPCRLKDVGEVGADWLVDAGEHHRETATVCGIAERYVIVPAYGSAEDEADPLAWATRVRAALLPGGGTAGGPGR